MRSQKEYWNSVADTKEFTTPMQSGVFCRYVNRDAAILDVGCGYGRVLNELHGLGFSHLRGIDFSEQLIRRGKRQFPFLDLQVQEAETIDAPDGQSALWSERDLALTLEGENRLTAGAGRSRSRSRRSRRRRFCSSSPGRLG